MALLTEEQELALQLGLFEINSPFTKKIETDCPTQEIERDPEFERPATD